MPATLPRILLLVLVVLLPGGALLGDEKDPPPVNPFRPRSTAREDALPGCVELSDGSIHPGRVYLTRDHKLKVFDEKLKRHREVPLRVVRRIDAVVRKEWNEKEWRFKENANDEKVYTGRTYPSREYDYKITLRDGRVITGPLAAIVYVEPADGEACRFLLHKRDKGEPDTTLSMLLYVRSVRLGEAALEEGKNAKKPRK